LLREMAYFEGISAGWVESYFRAERRVRWEA
jgi:hypothetical protein